MIPSTAVGTYTGTGAAINVILGFKPDFLIVTNYTDGDIIGTWNRAVNAAGTSTDIGAAAATNADNGFTAYPLATTASPAGEGFTAGTDFSESGKVYGYFAARSGPGAS